MCCCVGTTLKIDNSVTVKFGYVRSLGVDIPTVKKAKITTHRGAVVSLLEPFHTEFDLDSNDAFTTETVQERYTYIHTYICDARPIPGVTRWICIYIYI